jgi:hypothetical protein
LARKKWKLVLSETFLTLETSTVGGLKIKKTFGNIQILYYCRLKIKVFSWAILEACSGRSIQINVLSCYDAEWFDLKIFVYRGKF